MGFVRFRVRWHLAGWEVESTSTLPLLVEFSGGLMGFDGRIFCVPMCVLLWMGATGWQCKVQRNGH